MSEHKEPIPSMIYNAAVGGHVTNSQQIIDENENKEQSQINAEVKQNLGQGGSVDTRITQAKNDIIGGASSNGNTLKKVEDRVSPLESAVGTGGSVDSRIASAIATETTRAQAAEQLLQEQYDALTQSDIVVGALPASGTKNLIYRVPGTTSYSDYMWNGSAFVKMAEYSNAIDDEPTPMSNNLVKSGSVYGRLNSNSKDLFCYKNYIYNQNGERESRYGWNCTSLIPIKSVFMPDGSIRILEGGFDGSTSSHFQAIAFFNSSFVFISGIEDALSLTSVIPASVIPANAEYIAFSGYDRNVLVLDGLGTIPLYKQNVISPSNLVEFHNYAYVDGQWTSAADRISTKYPVSFRTDTVISTEINPNGKIIMFNVSDEDNSLTLSPQTPSGWSTGKFLINANQRIYITVAYSDNSAISPSVVDTMFKLFDANDNKLNATVINTSELFGDNIYFNSLNWYHIAWRNDLNQWQQNRQDIITSEAIHIEDEIKIFINPDFEAIILETDSTGETVYRTLDNWGSKCYEINKDRYIRIEIQYKGNTGSSNINPSIANTCGHIEHKSLRQDVKEVKNIINNFDLNLVKKVAYSKKYIICSQWNVGQFGGGNPRSTITAANYNKMAPLWNKEVAEQYANLCGLIEYNPIFGENTEHQNVSPDDIVWNSYPYKEVRRIEPAQSDWYGGCAINTMFPLSNTQKVLYSCFNGDEFPDYTKKSFYTLSEMTYMGVKVKVAECSCPFNMGGPYSDNTFQRLVYQELANTFANEEFVILMGDFELVNNNDYEIFTDAGYTLANGGDFGWFPTCPDSATLVQGVNALDNIIVKGFNIIDVEMSLSPLSDHYPLIATLDIKDN